MEISDEEMMEAFEASKKIKLLPAPAGFDAALQKELGEQCTLNMLEMLTGLSDEDRNECPPLLRGMVSIHETQRYFNAWLEGFDHCEDKESYVRQWAVDVAEQIKCRD